MNIKTLIDKVINLEFLTLSEGVQLYNNLPLSELTYIADLIRKQLHPLPEVTWIIDRNINIGNICISNCMFCNFCRPFNSSEAYTTTIDEYIKKINELIKIGGKQLLLQGGLTPSQDLKFYTDLFRKLKELFPDIKLHALGPPEIIYLTKISNKSIEFVLKELVKAGLDSLPGAGAEILSDRVRKIISPIKCSANEWLEVMRTAHKLNITTSATMMFGHLETIEERIEHLIKLRELQAQKPDISKGFISFTSWPFQAKGSRLEKKYGTFKTVSKAEYIRMVAISRIMLPNIPNIQASWLTTGKDTAQICLHAGANDLGSIMIEENVVSAAGVEEFAMSANEMTTIIKTAGFIPVKRNQQYEKFRE